MELQTLAEECAQLNPNSEVGEHARHGRRWPRLAASRLRAKLTRTLGSFRCARVFREGAENCARGGRAPLSISEFGLNEMFNRWIIHHTPFVTVKAAMTLDAKTATASGESKWITGKKAKAHRMKLRQGADAIMVGINPILMDDPALTVRAWSLRVKSPTSSIQGLRRIVLDSMARTPLQAKVVSDDCAALTTLVVSKLAPQSRVAALASKVREWLHH